MTTHVTQAQRFIDKTVLITGGGTGMGKAAALRFGREGANVVIAGRRSAELNQFVDEITAKGGHRLGRSHRRIRSQAS